MGERDISDSSLSSSLGEEKINGWYPMYIGVTCAFFALRLWSGQEMDDEKWSEVWNKMLHGSAQMLGLLMWKARKLGDDEGKSMLLTKLETAKREIEELKRIRHEDAKANEKVVGIFAAQEQRWLIERKKLRQQIGALVNDVKVLGRKKDEEISGLNDRLKEMEILVQSRDKKLEEEGLKRNELEEKLKKAENALDELREKTKHEAQEHASELWRHKTKFIELVSNQRQIEAEMGRARKQVDATKEELDAVLEQKEESVLMVQKLSVEMVKLQKDLEAKDNILSAMLRKSKLDTAEKQMLLKEVKLSKPKRKQAQLETERSRSTSESKHGGHSLSMLVNQVNLKLEGIYGSRKLHPTSVGSSHIEKARLQANDLLGYSNTDFEEETEPRSSVYESYAHDENEALAITTDVKRLEQWVQAEAEKYAMLVEQRHHFEMDAFVEQMRLKDEKLEAFRWRLLSMEIESKRLRSHIEGLNRDLSQLRHNNTKLEALLLAKEEEVTSLKQQLTSLSNRLHFHRPMTDPSIYEPEIIEGTAWSEVKIIKRRQGQKERKMGISVVKVSQEEVVQQVAETSSICQLTDVTMARSPEKATQEEKSAGDNIPDEEEIRSPEDLDTPQNLPSSSQLPGRMKNSAWKMDIQALGVFYKIKRLKQQLLMLERLMGKQQSSEDTQNKGDGQCAVNGFLSLVSLLNKQVGRYQSLQEKADELCKRMHENNLDTSHVGANAMKTRGRAKALENFLEETFQLQRYMVVAGQKSMGIQSKIAMGLMGVAEQVERPGSFDMKRFADSVRTMFQEVQRGLEVRIARIIGDLEGTLACDGMTHLRT